MSDRRQGASGGGPTTLAPASGGGPTTPAPGVYIDPYNRQSTHEDRSSQIRREDIVKIIEDVKRTNRKIKFVSF